MRSRLFRLVLLVALSAAPAFGQCAMCYTSAKGASTKGQTAITRGVLTLLLPPIGMMLGIVGFAFRYNRNPHAEDVDAMATPAADAHSE
jgi:hypothetical protein